ncbi:MAG: sensor histidine kinase [Campylobacterota bacterium]
MTKNITDSTQLNQILDNTIEGIIIIKDGFIINVNKSLVKILGYKQKEELVGNLATGILIPTLNIKYIKYNSETFQEVSLITKNAQIIPAILKIKNIKLDNESYKMVSILNMSDLKQKENMLIEQSRLAAMGEMISVIAHQWRQPLSAIASITTRIKMKIKMKKLDIELLEEKTDEINNYLQYMSKTIDDFRNFFEPTKNRSKTNLFELINASVKILEQSFKSESIKITIEQKDLSDIYVHKNEIVQVFINILNNSKDAFIENSTKNAKINISFEQTNDTQTAIIKDNAGGINNDTIKKIFDPYFSTKDKKNGTGLGLYICKNIIEKHANGSINVQNETNGVSFKITLPK